MTWMKVTESASKGPLHGWPPDACRSRTSAYDATTGLARTFGGAYGLGLIYANTMFGAHEGAH